MGSKVGKARLAFLAVALAFAGSVSGVTNPASADVVAQLNASQLVADMGAGWNLGNSLEANANGIPSETAWNNPTVTQALIDRVQAAGFKTIRIPVAYLGHIGSGPNYTVNSSWLNRIQEVVNYAYNRGMYVLINMHGDGFKGISGSWLICDSSSQATIRDKYQRVWQQVATRFQSYNERLIFESMNENFDGQFGSPTQPCYSNINAYNQIFVDTVRRAGGNNSSRWLLVPGWNTNIDYTAGNYGFVLPTDQYRSPSIPGNEQRIMISVHYYDPWDFAGTEDGTITQWGPAATNPSKTSSWGQEDFLDAQFKKMYDTFVVRGYPVFVGEYGAVDKTSFDSSNNRYRADFARTVVATAKKYGAATAYWDNGFNGQYGLGIFNRSSVTVTQQGIIDAIMGASPPPTSPPPTSPPPTSPPPGTAGCTATISNNAWTGGFVATVKVTAGAAALNSWSVSVTLPAGTAVSNSWNSQAAGTSGTVRFANASYNGRVPAGGSTEFGFQGTGTPPTGAPTCIAS
ncbi:cellulase family glycosylhydrolase [Micromonospora sp. CPCC 205371]|nr:cellulase family glycosylhydrolase [Micromonospora sp. CPCC 205371]